MRNTYLLCDNCGAGHIHKLPREGGILGNQWSWDKNQYVKNRDVLCNPCAVRKRKK